MFGCSSSSALSAATQCAWCYRMVHSTSAVPGAKLASAIHASCQCDRRVPRPGSGLVSCCTPTASQCAPVWSLPPLLCWRLRRLAWPRPRQAGRTRSNYTVASRRSGDTLVEPKSARPWTLASVSLCRPVSSVRSLLAARCLLVRTQLSGHTPDPTQTRSSRSRTRRFPRLCRWLA